jgi:probable rRNA maturation factor
MIELSLRNRQTDRAINLPMLRRLIRSLLDNEFNAPNAQLGVHLVSPREMAEINQHFLNHEGSTDVITFDHAEDEASDDIYGELFISVADAVRQGREFDATWQSELIRYVVHGILHLRGYDDIDSADRRLMKKEENRIMQELEARRDLAALEKRDKLS